MEKLKRDVRFVPGYDKLHSNPAKNYGISGGRFIFVVSGELGAVHFVLSADFYPESAIRHIIRHHNNDATEMHRYYGPEGWDVGYHAHTQQYENQDVSEENCEWIGGPCYSDGNALRGEEWGKKFVKFGTDWLWPALEAEYYERFIVRPADG